MEGQNPEFNILAFKNPEFRILEFQNPEFKNFGLNLEFRISVWPFKILNSEFWPSKILNSGFGHSKILNSGFCNSNSVHVITMKITLTVAVPTMLKHKILVDGKETEIVDFIKYELKSYNISFNILNTADFGVAQNRKRAIILLSKNGTWKLPKKEQTISVREAIGHLPSLESGEASNIEYHNAKVHNKNHILWLKHTPTGKTAFENKVHYPKKRDGSRIKGYSTTYKRIEWDTPAPTITMCNGAVSSQNNAHPGRLLADGTYSDARVLTLKEIFILTSLPDSYKPPSFASENFIRGVVGEGIPPIFMKKLIEGIL